MYKNITLIIPTFNRHEHLSRLLTYYSRLNCDINFLVLDSSSEDYKNKNKQFIAKIINNKILKIEHRLYDNIEPIIKIRDGLSQVKTKYCALCADDDVIFIDALVEAASHLEANENIVCVDGLYVNFFNNKGILKVNLEYSRASMCSKNLYERIFSLMQKYESLYYGVYRVDELRLIINGASKNDNLHFQELHQSVASLMLGEHYRLNKVYGARQHCEPADKKRENWQTIYWFSENSANFIGKYLEYKEFLYEFYMKNIQSSHIDKIQFNHFIDVSHSVFFSKACDAEYMYNSLAILWPKGKFAPPSNIVLMSSIGIFSRILRKLGSFFSLCSDIFMRIAKITVGRGESEIFTRTAELKEYCSLKLA